MDIRRSSADAEADRVTKSTVQRIMAGEASATLEQLDRLAKALDLLPYQLLIPDLDPNNPQVVAGATMEEQELYRKIARQAALEALQHAQTSPGTVSRRPRRKP